MSDAELIQGSPEWKAARAGSLGASSVHEVVARTKTGYSTSRANRLAATVVERLTGQPEVTFVNAAMQHGIDTEPEARETYSFVHGVDVVQVGLIRHPLIVGTHASPDGLIADDGGLEIKCPQPAAHLSYLLDEPIPDEYVTQCQWAMACTGRAWWDYASFQPAFPAHLRLKTTRLLRNDARIAELEKEVAKFLAEVDAAVAKLGEGLAQAA